MFLAFWVAVLWSGTGGLRSWSRRAAGPLLAPAVVLACGAAIVFFGASLRVRFELSESELLTLARDPPVATGGGVEHAAGLYTIQRFARTAQGAVMLVTHDCGLGVCGFAYAPETPPQDVCVPYDHRSFWHLTGDWFTFSWVESDGDC